MEDNNGNTALRLAIEKDFIEGVQMLLSHKDIDVNTTDKADKSLANYEIVKRWTESVKLLLSHSEIQINRPDSHGLTLLHHYILRGNVYMVKLLLSLPTINVAAHDGQGRTALDLVERLLDLCTQKAISNPDSPYFYPMKRYTTIAQLLTNSASPSYKYTSLYYNNKSTLLVDNDNFYTNEDNSQISEAI